MLFLLRSETFTWKTPITDETRKKLKQISADSRRSIFSYQSVRRAERVMPEQHILKFKNDQSLPKVQEVRCDAASVPLVMAWYGAYFSGDDYEVHLDGLRVKIDRNGEPINLAAVLEKLSDE